MSYILEIYSDEFPIDKKIPYFEIEVDTEEELNCLIEIIEYHNKYLNEKTEYRVVERRYYEQSN